jgi:histidine triad (HIT) family protein
MSRSSLPCSRPRNREVKGSVPADDSFALVGPARCRGSLPSVENCIFCAIVAGEAPATIIEEDPDTVAFMDINPWQRGHALVVPRRHYENLLEIEADDLASTFATAKRVAARMKEQLGADGVWLWNSCGKAAGQVVMHFHVHVIPTDGKNVPSPPQRDASVGEADIAAAAAALVRVGDR